MGKREGGGHGKRLLFTGGVYLMVEKDFFGSALIKLRHYWPKGVSAEEIIRHMQN